MKVCLLSPAHLWVNPRIRKEADALHAAGYDVVVGYRADGSVERDDTLLATAPWAWHRVDISRHRAPTAWAGAAVRQWVAQMLVRCGIRRTDLDAAAYCRSHNALVAWAIRQRADLYIAHTQPVLAAAAIAARALGAQFAFDCEDLLAEETADGGRAPWRRAVIRRLEGHYLPAAAYVSATSRPMAEYLANEYGLNTVWVWHNCFPTSESTALAHPAARPRGGGVMLAWISATIGQGRGLEDAFTALARLPDGYTLHLYGTVPTSQQPWLAHQLRTISPRVTIHPLPTADRVLSVLAQHDIGLSLDHPDCANRALTVCNKVFLYLHAGLACVATSTPGHASVLCAPSGPTLGPMYLPGDVDALVVLLARLADADTRLRAQSAAWDVGHARYTWDVERHDFLRAVADALAVPAVKHERVA